MTDELQAQICDATGCHGLNPITPPMNLAQPDHNDATGKETQPGLGESAGAAAKFLEFDTTIGFFLLLGLAAIVFLSIGGKK